MFTEEDEYVYLISHMYKHYQAGGTGIRSLTDIAVFLMNHHNLDIEMVERECRKLQMDKFEENVRCLADWLFCKDEPLSFPQLSSEQKEMLLYMISSGTYGNKDFFVKNELKKLAERKEYGGRWIKTRYLIQRMFPPYRLIKVCYPIVDQHKILIPGAYILRILKVMNRKDIWLELKLLMKNGVKR